LFTAEVFAELRHLQRVCTPVSKPHYNTIFHNNKAYPIVVISADMCKKSKMLYNVVKILCA